MTLDSQLAQLENSQLIRRLSEEELAYLFKHALTQEAAYESLLHKKRREIHWLVAQSYEQQYPQRLDEFAAILAQHYAEAGDDPKTLEYAIRAGDVAARVYAHPEARVHYALALDALSRLPDNDENCRRRVDTLIKQVSVSLRAAGPQQSLERLHQAETLLENSTDDASDRLRLARIHYWMGHAYVHGSQPSKAIAYMQRVLPVAQELNDPELLAIPASVIGRALGIQGKFGRAQELLTQALEPLERVENWHEWILAKAFQALTLAMQGLYKEAVEEGQRALARATAVQTLTGIGQSHVLLGLVYLIGDDSKQALAEAELAQQVARRGGDHLILYLSVGVRGLANMQSGDYAASELDIAELEEIRQRIGGRLALALWLAAAHAESLLRQNRIAEARALAEQTTNEARASDDIFAQGIVERVRGNAAARGDSLRWTDANAHFAASLRLFEEGTARLEAARTHVAWGKVLMLRGEINSAREHFEKAAAQFEASGLARELDETRRVLHEVQIGN